MDMLSRVGEDHEEGELLGGLAEDSAVGAHVGDNMRTAAVTTAAGDGVVIITLGAEVGTIISARAGTTAAREMSVDRVAEEVLPCLLGGILGGVADQQELPSLDDGDGGAGIGITIHSGAMTTAAVARSFTISGDRVVINIAAEFGTTTGVEEDPTKKLKWMVGILGGLSDSAATASAMYKSPRGAAAHGGQLVAYRVCIASVFVASVAAQMLAAFVVCSGPKTPQAKATGKKILYVSIFTLMLSIALYGGAIVLNM